MNTIVRLCMAVALQALSVAHAALDPYWSHRFTSSTLTYSVQATHIDPAGNVIVAGTITEPSTGSDIWVSKLDATNGEVIWTFRKDGAVRAGDKLGNIVVSRDGDVYVAGGLVNDVSTGTPDSDVYLARLNGASGAPRWEHDLGGNVGQDAWHDLTLDAAGNVIVTGVLTLFENSLGAQMSTASYEPLRGGLNWSQQFDAFETVMHDQGERVVVDVDGNIYVQGTHAAGTFGATNYPPTVQLVSYTGAGVFRWKNRIKEGFAARSYGFLPAGGGGYVVGLAVNPGGENTPTFTIATGKTDGSVVLEVGLPGVGGAPTITQAVNGDILYTGREVVAGVPPNMVAGRLSPSLSTVWVHPIPGLTSGGGTGFAHVEFVAGDSIVAGIAPGPASPDLLLTTFTTPGVTTGPLYLDGAADPASPAADMLPAGPALDAIPGGLVAVAVPTTGPAGQSQVLVRTLRQPVISTPPTIALISPNPAGPNVEALTPFQFQVAATDAENDPITVEFIADGQSLGFDSSDPFQIAHVFTTPGTHTIEAIASDGTGLKSTTGPITLVVDLPTPVVMTGGASRTGPASGVFNGGVSNLPFGGTARVRFQFSGPTIGFGFTTANVNVPANAGPQPLTVPFDIPEPHRSYDYFLEVTTTDGTLTKTAAGSIQTFTVPNAPVVPTADFFFSPRGPITGKPGSNDLDGDPGETLTLTFPPGPFPGELTSNPAGFAFVPGKNFTGELVLNYTVNDGHGSTVEESITIRNAVFYAGIYRALSPVTSGRLGAVDVVVNRNGRATVIVFLDGQRYSAAGELTQQGNEVGFLATFQKRSQPDRSLRLTWAEDRALTVQLVENDETIYIAAGTRASLSPFSVPQVYSLVGTHTNVSGNAAGRVSAFASLQLNPKGTATFRGSLGDGTSFVAKGRSHDDGRLAFYSALKGRASSFLLGRLQPNPADALSVGPGFAALQGTGSPSTPPYAAGYVDLVTFTGPQYVPPALGGSPLTFSAIPRAMSLSVTGGGFGGTNFTLPVWLSRSGGINGITGITRISIDGRTGELKGAFLPQGRRRTVQFLGILRPDVNGGMGVFRGPDAAGEVSLSPE